MTVLHPERDRALATIEARAAAVGQAELALSDAREALNAAMIDAVRVAKVPQKLVAARAGLSKQRISAILKEANADA